MNLIGKTTIHPVLFYSGKPCGYLLWVALLLDLFNVKVINGLHYYPMKVLACVLLSIGLLFATISLVNLGKSTRLGLPSEATTFKTKGIYRFSRNPMYLGFNLITLAAVLSNLHFLTLFMGIYSMTIYHFIILGEERFLGSRFGEKYSNYKQKVRRYI